MTMAALTTQARADLSAREEIRLDLLAEAIQRNRFLPEPDPESVFVGDGDYRAIGTEFLKHFVRIGGLRPSDRVLDIGSGIGRMAMPLTQFLDEAATYDGLDPVAEGVDWCARVITPFYPAFRFARLDVHHPIYNPKGRLKGAEMALPFPDGRFDFCFLTSVATHLPPDEVKAYAAEIARVLAPGGRLFLTAFVMDEIGRTGRSRDPRCAFQRTAAGPDWHADPTAPFGAVAFDEGWIEGVLADSGLAAVRTRLGRWRGIEAAHYQDIVLAEKPRSAA
ncbi:class I SAM-dependent methyltransferase [Chthonobacter rhizosphaerae]|uniref:class I SAM-dependent methyltransferase n=1 Tax=Chthonobacter rhizosphaerae TaxID=2735553 RepID=UPI0015EEE65E|nr:class I SAM-dependent methyltransferase [Chthonobacter rhizosphaerae]